MCLTVTLVDGLVLARSVFHHSMNYRSVVAFGRATPVTDEAEKARLLDILVEHLVPGRSEEARGANAKELAATEVLTLPLDQASAKIRTGPPSDAESDMDLEVWAGLVPLSLEPGEPIVAPDMRREIPAPDYVRNYRRPGTP